RMPPPVLVVAVVLVVAAVLVVALAAVARAGTEAPRAERPVITGRIVLDRRRIPAGETVAGRVVFENRTATRKVLLRTCAINGLYAIALRAADGYLQQPGFTLVACDHGLMAARPGRTAYRFKLRATYTGCSQSARDQQPRGSPNWMPLCLKDSSGRRDRMPPLPPGDYTALFVPDGRWRGPSVMPAKLVVARAH
ncbi:MAG: hypothetical protein ACRDKL_05860, partial [Solirubrobacteraceae bacterium]